MNSIYNLLVSPEWWFTAVFIAVPVGLLSAYMKEWLSLAIASISRRYNARRARKLAQQARAIELLVFAPQLLTLEFLRLAIVVVLWLMMTSLAFVFPLYINLLKHSPQYGPLGFLLGDHPGPVAINMDLLFGIINLFIFAAAMSVQWGLTRQVELCRLARRQLVADIQRLRRLEST